MLSEQDKEFLYKTLSFWDNLKEEEKNLILNTTVSVKYEKGDILHNGMNECVGVLLVKKGTLRTYILSEEGKEVTLYRLTNGDCCILSASCILKDITFDVSIDAQSDCEILVMKVSVFEQLMKKNVYVENFSYKVTAERFSDVMWAMEQILFLRFDQRLAIFLLDESKKQGSDKITMTHEMIAKYLGSAREVVSRMLKYFANENMVEVTRGTIEIKDKKKLKELLES
ncbi:Crp/Fnr family transcriptional regulator [Anaeromicropila herbilytica]|uniref:Crp/Fnr family transcriptional regulator n=1 Tax=Anaeromicropila herbilytica TaxID=2785025 RepID=A0A7R7IE73_9FIRM|nr:Crp/Fnr family transcriptional regulator [Anaeromicropila herbilytica]BCN32448.1 Crp/Fnr family transcriptional regulator [Anaeromicropila herbilytica]